MNAIGICKQYNIENLNKLSTHIIELDIKMSYLKHDIKVNDLNNKKDELEKLKEPLKLLQGHFNSIISKREILRNKFGYFLASKLSKQLIQNTYAEIDDIEFKKVKVVCRRGGFDLITINETKFYESKYKNTEIYKIIRC